MTRIDWAEFDEAVSELCAQLKSHSITHIIAVPRGGLCLATALSHALVVPLYVGTQPEPWMPPTTLAVDDMSIDGTSLQPFAAANMPCAVLVKHANAPAVSPFFYVWDTSEEEVHFPWEADASEAE